MTARALTATVIAVITVAMLCVGGLTALSGTALACAPSPATSGAPAGYDATQLANAATITTVGRWLAVSTRGQVIAVATAIQESSLRNLPNLGPANNADSLGLFQQRPSQGWGSPQQLADPVYASTAFYTRLLAVPGWQQMPLTEVAQAVQHSATPLAYARWESDAAALVALLGPHTTPSHQATATPGGNVVACLDGPAILARAATWLTAWHGGPVPYLSSGDPATWQAGYRRDCSGYVSMALGLPGPGLNTAGLQAHSTALTKQQLRAGDLLINPAPHLAGHVVLFDHWTDTSMSAYVGFEEAGGAGTLHRIISYPYDNGYPMKPFRFNPIAAP